MRSYEEVGVLSILAELLARMERYMEYVTQSTRWMSQNGGVL